ncbi:MAG: hypothetical protein WC966_01445 [Bradymonadales bacterium]|jgi:hypothetical protein
MSVYQISPYALEKDFREFFDQIGRHIDDITTRLLGTEISLANIPKRYGAHIAPYAFAGKILLLLDFARGSQSLSREFVEAALQDYAFLLGASAGASEPVPIDWEALKASPIARVLLAATARLKLNENAQISAHELFALTGFSSDRAKARGLEASEVGGQSLYEAAAVRRILEFITEDADLL